MKILILGNMANDGYAVAKELRKMNIDVDLAVNVSDFGMALPEWEETETIFDPYSFNPNIVRNSNSPSWIRYFDLKNKLPRKKIITKIMARFNLMKMIREYDIVEAHVPFAIYCQFSGVPYIAYDAGWIRYFPYGKSIWDKLARRGYKKAKYVIITNPDTFKIADSLPYLNKDRVLFCPFAIDTEKYRPLDVRELRAKYAKDNEILLFSPSRQIWHEKGNDKMLRAYAMFLKKIPNAKFIIVSWSIDEERSKHLAKSLGIFEKIEWIKPVPKPILIKYYNIADIVLDQFVLGSWGTSTPEAMACGKPVLMYYNKEYILHAFGEEPPILNSFTEEEIYLNLLKLVNDKDFYIDISKKSREWIIKTHSSNIVAKRHMEILMNSLH